MKSPNKLIKFIIASGIATLADLTLLLFFTEIIGIFYLASATMAFILGSSLNYSINKYWNFKKSKVKYLRGLLSFTIIGAIGLILTLSLMAFFVEFLNIHYLIARIIAAFLIVIWNFIMNRVFTFKN
jgi:putative flippase GtrA